jgi:hypothetical protein
MHRLKEDIHLFGNKDARLWTAYQVACTRHTADKLHSSKVEKI